MTDKKPLHVHFMGIGGSGCASLAMIAHKAGFKVSGCDSAKEAYYADELKKLGIPISMGGHSKDHITDDVDIVACTPAIFDIDPDNEELKAAKERGILMTWQQFMGRYLQKDKTVISVSGTHGKTTTTFLAAEILIDGGKDPTVVGGSTYRKWGNGGTYGESDLFLCEADEFNRNFFSYHPTIAVINNLEMDHQEYYHDFDEMLGAFKDYLLNSGKLKVLIMNGDSEGCLDLLKLVKDAEEMKNVRIILFSMKDDFCPEIDVPFEKVIYHITKKDETGTSFEILKDGVCHPFHTNQFGEYNAANCVTAILPCWEVGVEDEAVQKAIGNFVGVGRRFDLVGRYHGAGIYDDYAHHPTAVKAVLTMAKEYFPGHKVMALLEPHQVSRFTHMFNEFVDALNVADDVVIGKCYLGREVNKGIQPISKEVWEKASDKFHVFEDQDEMIREVERRIDEEGDDIIVNMGLGRSYLWSKIIVADDQK